MLPIRWLQVSLSFVLGQAALSLLLRVWHERPHGLHPAVAGTLAAVELLAAALFLIPRTLRWGGRLLWGALAAASVLHLHTGQVPPPVFLVCAAGIWVVLDGARSSGQARA